MTPYISVYYYYYYYTAQCTQDRSGRTNWPLHSPLWWASSPVCACCQKCPFLWGIVSPIKCRVLWAHVSLSLKCHLNYTHTHPFNGPFSGTTRMGRYQKGKTNLDFTEARDSEWQWHQPGHMQVCTSLQTDNHASTPPSQLLQLFLQNLPACSARLCIIWSPLLRKQSV